MVNGCFNKSQIEEVVLNIEVDISAFLKEKNSYDPSLLSSHAGLVIFYAYLFLHFKKDKYLNKALNILATCIDCMWTKELNTSLGTGFTGIAWVIQHLVELELLDPKSVEGLDEIDKYISMSITADFKQSNYDLFYGAIGKGVYFLGRKKDSLTKNCLESIIKGLESIAIYEETGITWECIKLGPGFEKVQCKELGLAHGVASVIGILSRIYKLKILQEKNYNLLHEAIDWMLKRKKNSGLCLYPIAIPTNNRIEWLAWCSGDLGIAFALYHAGKALGERQLMNEALNIVFNASRIDFDGSIVHFNNEKKIIDAGFCHGTLGLAYMFNKFYKMTKEIKFKERVDYWLNITLHYNYSNGDISNFLKYNGKNSSNNSWILDRGIIEGTAGIGLVLLSLINPKSSNWDRLFLTDITSH